VEWTSLSGTIHGEVVSIELVKNILGQSIPMLIIKSAWIDGDLLMTTRLANNVNYLASMQFDVIFRDGVSASDMAEIINEKAAA
jgi:hypothetical protein